MALLVTLVWLARRYEAGRLQERIELDAVDIAGDIRSRLARNAQNLQGLPVLDVGPSQPWTSRAASLLRSHREMLRIELRDADLRLVAHADSEARAAVFDPQDRADLPKPVAQACRAARVTGGPRYAGSRPVITSSGNGLEVLELCLPFGRRADVYLVASYALNEVLTEMVDVPFARAYDVSFSEVDGKRVAFHGVARSGNRTFSAQHVLELPGHALVLRLDSWRGTPALFPNFLTAMVVAMAIGLVLVLVLLARDTAPAPARRKRAGRRAGVSQGDGGFTGHRAAGARSGRSYHLCQSGLLPDGGVQCAGVDPGRYRQCRIGRRSNSTNTGSNWPGSRAASRPEKASSRFSCARMVRVFPC